MENNLVKSILPYPITPSIGPAAAHPKPHKKMIIDNYKPSVETVDLPTLSIEINANRNVSGIKQYKGKRDPSVPIRPNLKLYSVGTAAFERPLNGHQEKIDLCSSSEFGEDIVDLSSLENDESRSSADFRSGANETNASASKNNKQDPQNQLIMERMKTFERKVPCMTMEERVNSWKISPVQDDVEEFSSVQMMPFGVFLENYNENDRASNLIRFDYSNKFDSLIETFKVPHEPNASIVQTNPDLVETAQLIVIEDSDDEQQQEHHSYMPDNMQPNSELPRRLKKTTENKKEEFLKYLGIDANPPHPMDGFAKRSSDSDLEARFKRRSLRVKVQKIVINSMAKYNREKESMEKERRAVDNNGQVCAIDKTAEDNNHVDELIGGIGSSSKLPYRPITTISPKEHRNTLNISSTSASSSLCSAHQSKPDAAQLPFNQSVILARSRGRPRKLLDTVKLFRKNFNHLNEPTPNISTEPNQPSQRRATSHNGSTKSAKTKCRQTYHGYLNSKVTLTSVPLEPTTVSNLKDTTHHIHFNRSTSSASPYPQTTFSNEINRTASEKNFTSDEKTSAKSSPLIVNTSQVVAIARTTVTGKKVPILERRDYTTSKVDETTTSKISPLPYTSKVLMETTKYDATRTQTPVSSIVVLLQPPISERLQLKQIQKLSEITESNRIRSDPPVNRTRLIKASLKRPINMIPTAKHRKIIRVSNPEVKTKTSDTRIFIPQPLPRMENPATTTPTVSSKLQQKAISQLNQLGVPSTRESTRQIMVQPRRIRKLSSLKVNLRSRSHIPTLRRNGLRMNAPLFAQHPHKKRFNKPIKTKLIVKRRINVAEEDAVKFKPKGKIADNEIDHSPAELRRSPSKYDPRLRSISPGSVHPACSSLDGSSFNGWDDDLEVLERLSINSCSHSCSQPDLDIPANNNVQDTPEEDAPNTVLHSPHPPLEICDARSHIPTADPSRVSRSPSENSAFGTCDTKNETIDMISTQMDPVADADSVAHNPIFEETATQTDLIPEAIANIIGVVHSPKFEDVEVKSMLIEPVINTNPLHASSGTVIAVLTVDGPGNELVVVQEREVSFWRRPSRVHGIFGVTQQWKCLGSVERLLKDTELDSSYQNRVLITDGQLTYVECRAKQFDPTETRECFLASVFMNVYYVDRRTGETRMHMVDLDTVQSVVSSIRYTVLEADRSIAMSWTQQELQNTRCGLCKYTLAPEQDTLTGVMEFPFVQQSVLSLISLEDDKLIGFGESSIIAWDSRTGDKLLDLDIEQPIGVCLSCFLDTAHSEKYMFLIHLVPGPLTQKLELLAVNLSGDCFTWKVVHQHDLPSDFLDVSTYRVSADHLAVIFKGGQSLLLSLCNPKRLLMRRQHVLQHSSSVSSHAVERCQSFLLNDQIVQIFEERMGISTICDHFFEA